MGRFEDNQNISYLGTKNAFGNLPVVDLNQEYIGIFKGVGSTNPMVKDNSSFFLTYLVNSEGNAYKVSEDSTILNDIVPNFLDNPCATIRLDQATRLNETLAGEQKITDVGTPTPILYTQTGSEKLSNVEDIRFTPPGVELSDVKKYIGRSQLLDSKQTFNNNPDQPNLQLQSDNDIWYFSPNPGNKWSISPISQPDDTAAVLGATAGASYSALNFYVGVCYRLNPNSFPDPDLLENFTLKFSATLRTKEDAPFYCGFGDNCPFSVEIFKLKYPDQFGIFYNPTGTTRSTLVAQDIYNFSQTSTNPSAYTEFSLEASVRINRSDLVAGDVFYARIKRGVNGINPTSNIKSSFHVNMKEVNFEVSNQEPYIYLPDFIDDQNPKGYWETGSARILTSSQYLGGQYSFIQNPLTSSEDFGFPPINSPFIIQPGDKIRFEYSNDTTFTVYEVIEPTSTRASGSRIYLKLNRDVPSNLNTNNFVIYRIVRDGQFIIVDKKKNEEDVTEFTGAIVPEFLNAEFREKIDSIIKQLKQDGIIEE